MKVFIIYFIIFNIFYSIDNRQIYIYDFDDNYYVDFDDYGDVGYYYDDDLDDENIFDWFYQMNK